MQALPANLLAKVQQFSFFAKIYVYLVRKTSSVAELFAKEIRLICQQHDIKNNSKSCLAKRCFIIAQAILLFL
jgi:hypothetical protein